MDHHQDPSANIARQQIAERVADASTRRLARHLPHARRHRLGLGLGIGRADRLDG